MKLHRNARTCPCSRRLLVERIETQGWPRAQAPAAAGISERTAAKWLARCRAEGGGALRPLLGPPPDPASNARATAALVLALAFGCGRRRLRKRMSAAQQGLSSGQAGAGI
jgi:hypothetical protein